MFIYQTPYIISEHQVVKQDIKFCNELIFYKAKLTL